MQQNNILGVVLCGGLSSRMGQDKGLITQNNTTWAELAYNKLTGLGLPVVVSVRRAQETAYRAFFEEEAFVFDEDGLDVGGPLKGILSVHLQHTNQNLFVLACDMPLVIPELLQYLLIHLDNRHTFEAIVFNTTEGVEPLCCVYTAAGLGKILLLLKNGHLVRHSMKYVLGLLRTRYMPLPDRWFKHMRNFNKKPAGG